MMFVVDKCFSVLIVMFSWK